MRICLYTDTALPMLGGQEHVVDALARQFTELGHEAVVLAPWPRGGLRPADSALPYEVARHPRFVSTRHFVAWYGRWLLKLHRRRPLDVVHCHSVYPTGYIAAANRRQLGIPTVITSHGGDVDAASPRLARPWIVERSIQALASADALVAISRFTRDGYRRLLPGAGPIVEIPNGIDLEPYAQPAPRPAGLEPAVRGGEYWLFIGRLDRRKGVDVLLEALALLPPSGGVELVVAGSGREQSALEAYAVQLGLTDRVRFAGQTLGSAKTYLLQNALATVVPSRGWESFGLVVLESYAAGRPVIASRLPGLGDLVNAGRTGWLVAPESPGELAAALAKSRADRRRTDFLGTAGQTVAANHAWRDIAQRHIYLFASLTEPRRRRVAA